MFNITYKKKSLPHLFTLADDAAHRKMKRPLANAYAMTSILEMEGRVDSCVEHFRCRFDDFALSTESVDFGVRILL